MMNTRMTGSIAAAVLFFSSLASADYVPYPGTIPVDLVRVEAANVAVVSIETWPGFRRNLRITVAGIAVPRSADPAPACERALASRAMEFTTKFLSDAEEISVKDMVMRSSGVEDAASPLLTPGGSLSDALMGEKLARPSHVEAKKPWC